jgi:hypothetical protein
MTLACAARGIVVVDLLDPVEVHAADPREHGPMGLPLAAVELLLAGGDLVEFCLEFGQSE